MGETGVKKDEVAPKPSGFLGIRHIQYCMLFTVMATVYGIRSILSVAIYAMTTNEPPDESIPTYPDWTDKKNIMLSSFFWGYICFQVGAGQLAKKYGPKYLIGSAAIIGSACCCLVPFLGSQFGYKGVIASRIITGLTQGFIFPCVHSLISSWAAIHDRAKVGSFVYAGGPLGNVIAMPVAGFISGSKLGWPVVFYLYGALGMAWGIIWFIVGFNSPSQHPKISYEERRYIEWGSENEEDKDKIATPWKKILTSLPFWAILVAHCGQNFGFWMLLTEIPSYMAHILKFDIKENSYLSALPYLVNWLLSLVMSPLADYLIVHYIKLGTSRKIFNSIGLFIPALALFGLSFATKEHYALAVGLLVIAVGFNSAIYSGYNVNHIDISPVHAGTLMGLTNSISNIFSLLSPLAVDFMEYVTGYEEDQKILWTMVFGLAGIIYIVVGIFFNVYGSGEVQPWNNIQEEDVKKNKNSVV